MAIEQYANLGATALTANYTAGSGSITVTSTVGSPAFSTAAPFRVVISNGTTIKVILKVTAITDSTHFAVIAEGTDANGTSGDNVYQVLTAGGLDGIRAAIQQSGSVTTLPSTPQEGDIYHTTDDVYTFRRAAGSVWETYGPGNLLVAPSAVSFTNLNSPTVSARANGSTTLSATGAIGGHNIIGQVITAPATPYTITAALIMGIPSNDFTAAGLMWRNSTSGSIVTAGLAHVSNQYIASDNYTNPTTFSANVFRVFAFWSHLIWLQISDDGTTRTIKYSYDGLVWLTAGTESHTAFITPDQVGWFFDLEGVGPGSVTLIHWKQT